MSLGMLRRLTMTPAVQWHEGMLLSPHHFQQQEVRNEQKLAHHMYLLPYPHFGTCVLQIDPILLTEGIVRILYVEAVMPDGLIVIYKDGKDLPPLELALDKNDSEILVHLCLASSHFIEGSTISGDFPRYYSVPHTAVDLNTGENSLEIPALVPRLFLHPSIAPWATGFPIMRIKYEDGFFSESAFSGPCFFVLHETPLWQKCATLSARIREKTVYFSERYASLAGTPLFIETSLILRTLLNALCAFEAMVHGPLTHPAILYQSLCQTVGHLAGLKPSSLPPVLPAYHHMNLDTCFQDVLDLAHHSLDQLSKNYLVVKCQQKERLFSVLLQQNYGEKLYIGVRGQRRMSYVETENWFHNAVICSDFAIDTTRIQRITGAHRELIKDARIQEILPSREILIFEVKNDISFIKYGQHLHIFNPSDQSDTRPLEIFLYIPQFKDNV